MVASLRERMGVNGVVHSPQLTVLKLHVGNEFFGDCEDDTLPEVGRILAPSRKCHTHRFVAYKAITPFAHSVQSCQAVTSNTVFYDDLSPTREQAKDALLFFTISINISPQLLSFT